ncbi:L-glyceraldehyde 3-phosphate reductase [Paenibacillus sp. SYP-B3998]|uniref:L-glyceraldehyde 3-phosphate reductase n=1 Tax=Paenibacillus sp. SYP-B3998 TaxID=2678564 RepID=A0A6G3ZRZ0_9BACL|nr:aldo/keto reductase [Paenibacillus sp. SYP-B3998]NEW04976.1 L-glyceraldehyde 3-phosphate reductase [Paenibacillus sp. SYP-B3998]
MIYQPSLQRYADMKYNRCGKSGLKLPAISLGLWHNFGDGFVFNNCREMVRRAFDLGITHFDVANNYGWPGGSSEETLGKIIKLDFASHRDEMIISTKAGWDMWPGPYGDEGSKKYLVASLDQSLKRLGLDYVDIYYHHRPDPNTPIEETMGALDLLVRQGKALYVGISSYDVNESKAAIDALNKLGTPCLIHQPAYSMLDRTVEDGLLDLLEDEGVGSIAFFPLAQGILTNKYLSEIPADSRAASGSRFLKPEHITEDILSKTRKLNELAAARDQSLAQMAIAWVLRGNHVTSALVGASRVSQIEENVAAINNLDFSESELQTINAILNG